MSSRLVQSVVRLDAIDRANVDRARQVLADSITAADRGDIAALAELGRVQAELRSLLNLIDQANPVRSAA